MAWTAPATVVSGTVIATSWGNTYVRDNTAYLKSLLDGTGTGIQVTVPGVLSISNDANYLHYVSAGLAVNLLDANDYWYYDRAANTYNWDIAGGIMLTLAAGGKLTGAGFYDSGEVSVANSATATVSHGLSARPRFVFGFMNTATGAADTKLTQFSPGTPSATQLNYTNITGSTRYLNFYAML